MRLLIALILSVPVSLAHAQTCTPPVAGAWGGAGATPGHFDGPACIATGPDGNLYVADEPSNRVQKFNGNGIYLGEWSTGSDTNPAGIAIDPTGVVYVALHHVHRVAKY